jgi:hypothetical protein
MALVELNEKELSTLYLALMEASEAATDLLTDEELQTLLDKLLVEGD